MLLLFSSFSSFFFFSFSSSSAVFQFASLSRVLTGPAAGGVLGGCRRHVRHFTSTNPRCDDARRAPLARPRMAALGLLSLPAAWLLGPAAATPCVPSMLPCFYFIFIFLACGTCAAFNDACSCSSSAFPFFFSFSFSFPPPFSFPILPLVFFFHPFVHSFFHNRRGARVDQRDTGCSKRAARCAPAHIPSPPCLLYPPPLLLSLPLPPPPPLTSSPSFLLSFFFFILFCFLLAGR